MVSRAVAFCHSGMVFLFKFLFACVSFSFGSMRTQKFCSDHFISSLPGLLCPFLESASPLLCSFTRSSCVQLNDGGVLTNVPLGDFVLVADTVQCTYVHRAGVACTALVVCVVPAPHRFVSGSATTDLGAAPCAAMSQCHRDFSASL